MVSCASIVALLSVAARELGAANISLQRSYHFNSSAPGERNSLRS